MCVCVCVCVHISDYLNLDTCLLYGSVCVFVCVCVLYKSVCVLSGYVRIFFVCMPFIKSANIVLVECIYFLGVIALHGL